MNKEKLERYLIQKRIPFFKNKPMSEYTTLKLGGPAWFVVEVQDYTDIVTVKKKADECSIPMLILGNGSNILFKDKEFEGIVVVLAKKLKKIEVVNTNIIAEAGASLMDVCDEACKHSLMGMEFAYGIPGSVGGAIYMNAGAFEGEVKDIVREIQYIDEDGNIKNIKVKPKDFSYRKSMFTDTNKIILKVIFELSMGNRDEVRSLMDRYWNRRKERQPLEYPSAGSVFKRPVGDYASRLIDVSGLKGKCCGGAMVSEKHAGFLINYDHATSNDFIELIEYVQKEVKKQTGFDLECEIKIVENKKQ
ncbi:UDP-N-acetylmuramate dehydrogenase [Anaerorhabdus sp.]|uniref:UDP-N-acetylmuramate dehydrogenase n=1 Tax=Anaerorhabdus sp. TaxID=1872524 RepID=UPI002FC9446A